MEKFLFLLVSFSFGAALNSDKIVKWPASVLAWTPTFDTYSDYVIMKNMTVQYYTDSMTTSPTTTNQATHHIHYILTTYNNQGNSNALKDAAIPVIFWFNGGPGCSSVGGMFTENGPFRISPQGILYENIYAWNKLGHVVYVESPSDIGFSYSTWMNNGTEEMIPHMQKWSDSTSGELNAYFIHSFFVANPDLANNPFYITGESYAGVYIPEMTYRIRLGIQNGVNPNTLFQLPMNPGAGNIMFSNPNIKGIAIGNGYVNDNDIINTLVLWQRYHGNIGIDRWSNLKQCCHAATGQPYNYDMDMCDYTQFILKVRAGDYLYKDYNNSCDITVWLAIEELLDHTTPDAYNIYQQCYNKPSASSFSKIAKSYRESIVQRLENMPTELTDSSSALWNPSIPQDYDPNNYQSLYNYDSTDALYGTPCFGDNATYDFLNLDDIKTALKIDSMWINGKYEWTDCDNFTYWSYDHNTQPGQDDHMLSIIQPFTPYNTTNAPSQMIKVMFYSGDTDSVCNWMSSEWFANRIAMNVSMNSPALTVGGYNQGSYYNPSFPRKKWTYHSDSLSGQNQLAGFYEVYTPMNMKQMPQIFVVTVNGAGHFVPLDRAGAARQMLYNFMWKSDNITMVDFSMPDNLNDIANDWTTQKPATTPASASALKHSMLLSILTLIYKMFN